MDNDLFFLYNESGRDGSRNWKGLCAKLVALRSTRIYICWWYSPSNFKSDASECLR